MSRLTITNIGELITLAPLAKAEKLSRIEDKDLGRVANAWLAVENGKIVASGNGVLPASYNDWPTQDAEGGLVMPGLVDAHTHPLFGGNRAHEFCQRLAGTTYQQIAAAGGGIKYTVKQSRETDDATLLKTARDRLQRFLKNGVTTLEVKTGYGLSVKEELRHLRLYKKLRGETSQHLSTTCLALHALPPEATSVTEFVKTMTEELLPAVAKEKLADFVDAFVEKGYFLPEDCDPYFKKAQELGFKIRIHADEFVDSGAAAAACRWGALSADHLEFAHPDAIQQMAAQNIVAVLLPGTSLYTKIPYTKAAPFLAAGCPIALATDFNPGSCQVDNLGLIATIGALHCGLDLPHTVAAVTYVPAYSLALHQRKGALAQGFDADILWFKGLGRLEEWVAGLGQEKPARVWINGVPVGSVQKS